MCAFWRNLNKVLGVWKCWGKYIKKDAQWCLLTQFESMLWKYAKWSIPTLFETLYGAAERKIPIVFYMSILNSLKTRTIHCTFWCHLKRYFETAEKVLEKFGILMLLETKFWNCRENLRSNEAKWYILTLFETYAWQLLGEGAYNGSDPWVP